MSAGQVSDPPLGERELAYGAVRGALVAAAHAAAGLAGVVARALASDGQQDVALRAQSEPLLVDVSDLSLAVILLELQSHRRLEGANEAGTGDAGASSAVSHDFIPVVGEVRGEGGKFGELRVAGLNGQGVLGRGDGGGELRGAEDVVEADL
jgi:hypothetical protein